jgi:L-alanine-DL-glutamate epimerase-like enolase superfamily enzyme
VPGLNRQYQVNPLHLYEERRPKAFKDPAPGTKEERRPLTHYYVRIRTRGGTEGIYGAVDKEALPVLLGNLRPLVIGQHALAVERIWDQMYRSNRHSRASHYMMAISYMDNALWDLRGRALGAPVFRLLGGPTQMPVPVYGSCLGFSIDPPLAGKRAAQLKKDGFHPPEVVHGLRPRRRRARHGPERAAGEGAARGRGRRRADHVRCLPGLGPAIRHRVVPQGRAVPALLARGSRADVGPRELHPAEPGHSVPIATGEHLYGRWEAEQFFKNDALQFIQADPEWCGGVSETVKVANLAIVHGVKLLPHCHNVHAALPSSRASRPACALSANT